MILNKIISSVRKSEKQNFDNFDPKSFHFQRGRELNDPIPILKKEFFLITEIKKASPSAGLIKKNFNPLKIATEYQAAGASAISVLTENKHFQGDKRDIVCIGDKINIPILRKDFIIHPFQIYESYNLGADIILLIAACLSEEELKELYVTARKLGLQVIIEVHSEAELKSALKIEPDIIGINNRDLKTFRTDISTSINLKKKIPDNIFVISESGIRDKYDIKKLKEAGFSGALVGESLMRSKNIQKSIREFIDV